MKVYEMKATYKVIADIAPTSITNPREIVPTLRKKMRDYWGQEQFWVICLNGSNNPVSLKRVTIGLVNQTQVHPREVFAPAILAGATSILIAHNHPSGNSNASGEDIAITRRLVEAGELLAIPVLDHLIVTDDSFLSIRASTPSLFGSN